MSNKMFEMFKKGAEKKSASPVSYNKIKYEKTLYDLRSRRDQIQDNVETIDLKLEILDKEIKSLISQRRNQQAKNKLVEMKGLEKQTEGMQTKFNVLTEMMIQIETLEQDQSFVDAIQSAADLAKFQELTNEQLQEAMMDWSEFQTSQQETTEIWKQMADIVNMEELDADFEKYVQENEQQEASEIKKQLNQVPANKVPAQQPLAVQLQMNI